MRALSGVRTSSAESNFLWAMPAMVALLFAAVPERNRYLSGRRQISCQIRSGGRPSAPGPAGWYRHDRPMSTLSRKMPAELGVLLLDADDGVAQARRHGLAGALGRVAEAPAATGEPGRDAELVDERVAFGDRASGRGLVAAFVGPGDVGVEPAQPRPRSRRGRAGRARRRRRRRASGVPASIVARISTPGFASSIARSRRPLLSLQRTVFAAYDSVHTSPSRTIDAFGAAAGDARGRSGSEVASTAASACAVRCAQRTAPRRLVHLECGAEMRDPGLLIVGGDEQDAEVMIDGAAVQRLRRPRRCSSRRRAATRPPSAGSRRARRARRTRRRASTAPTPCRTRAGGRRATRPRTARPPTAPRRDRRRRGAPTPGWPRSPDDSTRRETARGSEQRAAVAALRVQLEALVHRDDRAVRLARTRRAEIAAVSISSSARSRSPAMSARIARLDNTRCRSRGRRVRARRSGESDRTRDPHADRRARDTPRTARATPRPSPRSARFRRGARRSRRPTRAVALPCPDATRCRAGRAGTTPASAASPDCCASSHPVAASAAGSRPSRNTSPWYSSRASAACSCARTAIALLVVAERGQRLLDRRDPVVGGRAGRAAEPVHEQRHLGAHARRRRGHAPRSSGARAARPRRARPCARARTARSSATRNDVVGGVAPGRSTRLAREHVHLAGQAAGEPHDRRADARRR